MSRSPNFSRLPRPAITITKCRSTKQTTTTRQNGKYNEFLDPDSSSGCELSFDMKSPSPTDRKLSLSPPYKKVRALRLFDSPLTPKTIIKKCGGSSLTPVSKVRLFAADINANRSSIAVPDDEMKEQKEAEEELIANVNPFTPSGMLLSKKRSRSIRSPKALDFNNSDEHPPKRLALSTQNISRYHQEFLELSLIGCGQFGSVFKCINRLDGCTYAIKKSTKPITGSAFEKQALNEVYAHAVLGKHLNVVRYYSAWSENNFMFIQNEYCNGGSLAEKIAKGGGLSRDEIIRMLQHVAEGLRYIHSEQLVHLDIKPANIFISIERKCAANGAAAVGGTSRIDDGFAEEDTDDDETMLNRMDEEEILTYKIGDLGHVTSQKDPQVEEGDCRYLSNEILQEDYRNLTKGDVFALGLSVIEAASGLPLPKNGPEWHELRNGQIPQDKLEVISLNFDCDLIDLIKRMIQRDVEMRPSAKQILQDAALCPIGAKNKTYEQLHRELNAVKLKNEILMKQLQEAAICLKKNNRGGGGAGGATAASRLIGKNGPRSMSLTSF